MHVLVMMSGLAMGGSERNVVSVIPYLAAQGVEPILCTLNTRRDSPLAEAYTATGLPRMDLGAHRMVDLAAFRHFLTLLKDQKIDLIHSHDQDSHIYTAVAHRLTGIPTVMTRHVMFEDAPTFKTKLRAQMVITAAKYGIQRVIAVSNEVRRRFLEQTHLPADKVVTLYNGIDLERFNTKPQRDAKRRELGWTADELCVPMVGVLRPGKGHDVLLNAVPQLKAALPNLRLKVIGDGPLREGLMATAAPYHETVEFMGQRTDIPEILGASDATVLPSWSEGLPTVLIEAAAASLPVVATDVGGTSEVVIEGETGYLVKAGDAAGFADRLIALLSDPSKADAIGQAAYQRAVQLFTLEQQAANTKQLYQTLLK